MPTNIDERYKDLLFGVQRSVRYHTRRRAFFEHLHSFVLFIGVVGGSASVGALLANLSDEWSVWALLPGIFVTLFSTIDLVVRTGEKSCRHAGLSRRFIELEQAMQAGRSTYTKDILTEWEGERLKVEADEVHILRILDLMCHNELAQAMGYKKTQCYRIPLWQRLIAHFFNWRVDQIELYPPETATGAR